jgi:WhiB family redox-sensing transcriptional regulator
MAVLPTSPDVGVLPVPSPLATMPLGSNRWMTEGACVDNERIEWFPADELLALEAKAVCRTCRVKAQCLSYALAHHEYGVWGGTTEQERRALRKLARPRAPRSSTQENSEDRRDYA